MKGYLKKNNNNNLPHLTIRVYEIAGLACAFDAEPVDLDLDDTTVDDLAWPDSLLGIFDMLVGQIPDIDIS